MLTEEQIREHASSIFVRVDINGRAKTVKLSELSPEEQQKFIDLWLNRRKEAQ